MANKKKETRSLMGAWVCELAYRLMDEECMTRSEAFRRAHLTRELLENLGQGKVTFLYVRYHHLACAFDRDVFTEIIRILSKIMAENGVRED